MSREKLRDTIKSALQTCREKTMRDILFDLLPGATQEIIAVQDEDYILPFV